MLFIHFTLYSLGSFSRNTLHNTFLLFSLMSGSVTSQHFNRDFYEFIKQKANITFLQCYFRFLYPTLRSLIREVKSCNMHFSQNEFNFDLKNSERDIENEHADLLNFEIPFPARFLKRNSAIFKKFSANQITLKCNFFM